MSLSGQPSVGTAPRLRPEDGVATLHGVGPATARMLTRAGLACIRDLLLFFPRRHDAVQELSGPVPAAIGERVRLAARVEGARRVFLPGRRSVVTVALVAADGTPLRVSFFNQPYLVDAWPAGTLRLVEGVLGRDRKGFFVRQARLSTESGAGSCTVRYAKVEGVSEQRLVALLRQALSRVDLSEWTLDLPAGMRDAIDDPRAALRAMHRPRDVGEHERARATFALVEAVALFRGLEAARSARVSRPAPGVVVGTRLAARIEQRIPFRWTRDQAAAVESVRRALAGPAPMGLLLQGDVGTGKTAVAMWAALAVIAAGHQVAFLAPTELLAEQHHAVLGGWLAGSGVRCALLTATQPADERRAIELALASGEITFVFGTHALLSARTVFADLGLAIVDEQHRFGVEQRALLMRKGRAPHLLVMTATPIPRTLTLALFGDLDVAVLRDKPPGHRTARAVFVPPRRWPIVVSAIERRLRRGRQVFVVCPKVGEDGGKGGAVRLHRELSKRFTCGLVHGRMPATARREATAAFRRGDFGVLVGTTVLEVGVDVPNATLMVIVGAERFGLATLHQLRGRVGRGPDRGLCVLTGADSERVCAVCSTTDGFELAERDLLLRGTGELLGVRQSGLGELRALDPLRDLEILLRARQAVAGETR